MNVPYEHYRQQKADRMATIITKSDGSMLLVVDEVDEFMGHVGPVYYTLPDIEKIRSERSRLLSMVADLDALVDDMTIKEQEHYHHSFSSKEL